MKLHSIEIHNFRCFEHLELELHPQLNVFVGLNGSGKTALLEALKLGVIGALGEMKETIPQKTTGSGYTFDSKKDPRLIFYERGEWVESDVVEVRLRGFLGGNQEAVSWARMLKKVNVRFSRENDFSKIKPYFNDLYRAYQSNADLEFPLFAYYSTGRLFLESNDTGIEMNGKRIQGYVNASTAKSSQFLFKKWFEKSERGQEKYQKHGVNFDFSAFEQVKQIITSFIPDCKGIFFDEIRFKEVVFIFDDGKMLPYSMLSDGTRNLVALVSDLSLRSAVLNPWLGDKINSLRGVVLIDEVDLHLHPSWQRQVIPKLLKSFPNVQFFITTHSPQVISNVPKESVFIINGTKVESGLVFTEGRDSNSLLQDVFDIPKRPLEDQILLNEFYEYFITQSRHPLSPFAEGVHQENELRYQNMLGTCQGTRNCSGIRKNYPLVIDPRNQNCESLVKFNKDGSVYSDNERIIEDIKILELHHLSEQRKVVIDKAREEMVKLGAWTNQRLENEILRWKTKKQTRHGLAFEPYCMAAVHYLESKKSL